MVNALKFITLFACQKGLDKQFRPRSDCFMRSSLIRVFPVCYSDKHFVNSPDNLHFIGEQKEKCSKFRTFTLYESHPKRNIFLVGNQIWLKTACSGLLAIILYLHFQSKPLMNL